MWARTGLNCRKECLYGHLPWRQGRVWVRWVRVAVEGWMGGWLGKRVSQPAEGVVTLLAAVGGPPGTTNANIANTSQWNNYHFTVELSLHHK